MQFRKMMKVSLLILMGALTLVGCQKANEKNASSIVIQVPGSPRGGNSKVGALAAIPMNRKACYGVSITASDIASHASMCSPATGIVAGFVESGGTLETTVPRGSNRRIDLFLFLQPEGEDNPCPVMGQNLSGSYFPRTYLIGTASGVSLQKDVETITITASFPGLASNIAQQFGLPSTCSPASNPVSGNPGLSVSAAQGTVTGGGMRLVGKVGRNTNATTAAGGGYRIKVNQVGE